MMAYRFGTKHYLEIGKKASGYDRTGPAKSM
jgi:hypothetical protein